MTVELLPTDISDVTAALIKLQAAINSGGGGGGLIGFSSSLDTTAPNNVVPVAVLMAFDGVSENDQVDVAIVPSGVLGSSTTIGAFSLQAPDGTVAGGNKRGTSAVDLQLWRNAASQVASGLSSFAAGSANTASGFLSVAIGDLNTNAGPNCAAIGEFNTINAGSASSAAFGYRNVINAGSNGSFTAGQYNQVSANSSFTVGSHNIVSGANTFTGGFTNTVSGSFSMAVGQYNLSDAYTGFVLGSYGASRAIDFSEVFGMSTTTLGTFQRGHYVLQAITSNATPTVLTTQGGSGTSMNQVALPAVWAAANSFTYNGAAYIFQGKLVAIDIATGNSSGWTFQGVIKQGTTAATTALVAAVTPSLIAQDSALSATIVAISADTTNGAIAVTVTGITSTNIQWMCDVQTSETTY